MSMISFTISGNVVSAKRVPVASFVASQDYAVLGSVISLDGRPSSDPDGYSLTYSYGFLSVPISSKVALEGFRQLDDIGALVSFSPDIVGQYVVGLFVSNGVFESPMLTRTIDVRAILVPHARGIVPDGKFVWSYLRDVWTQVDDKEFFETLWSALIQIAGGELLKLYQNDWNKSIRDIQDLYQRRWLSFEPKLVLSDVDCTFFLGNSAAGREAFTGPLGEDGLSVILSHNELLVVQGTVRPNLAGDALQIIYSRSPEDVGSYVISGITARQDGFLLTSDIPKNPQNSSSGETTDVILWNAIATFDFQSTTWALTGASRSKLDILSSMVFDFPFYRPGAASFLGDVRIGDVIVVKTGINSGFYRIVGFVGDSSVIVDHKPPGAGLSSDDPVNVYRPVGFFIPSVETGLTDTIAIPLSEAPDLSQLVPGRIIVVNDVAYTIARIAVAQNQRVPAVVITVEEKTIIPGLKGLAWRVPHTLISQTLDFETLGVRPGDTLIATIHTDRGTSCDVNLQVVGASGNRLGFVLSVEDLHVGQVPEVDSAIYLDLGSKLNISQVALLPDQSLAFSGDAKSILTYLRSIYFRRAFWNTELSSTTVISVVGWNFTLSPRAIIRNRLVPVDASVRSIPALQEYIVQPTIQEEAGQIFQVRGDKKISLARRPVVLTERMHYVVDGSTAFSGDITFRTGTDLIDADGGDFVDLGVSPGDIFHIESPLSLYGDYPIIGVVSRNRLRLSRPVPKYPLSDYVTGTVVLERSLSDHFIRFIPGLFSAKNPAPNRLWAEVVFFDNSENVERNFGLLVGLSRQDLETATSQSSYRQAVAGLMFAYVSGSAVNKIRLGVSLLLGLPFTEKRGIIRSIELDYRLDATGTPILGRILVEDIDEADSPLGVFRIYTFPLDPVSDLAGVDTNPNTGKAYQVGDIVEAFSSLSKGVEIDDFEIPYSGSRTAEQMLQQYHSARVRVNDKIFQPEEIALVSRFLREITPSYVAVSVTSTSEFADSVKVLDKSLLSMITGPLLGDTVGIPTPFPVIYDHKSLHGVYSLYWGSPPYWIRRAGKDLSVDLTTPTLLHVASGGILTPRTNELFEAPLCQVGDVLLISYGINAGMYTIDSIPSDSSLTVLDGPVNGFAPSSSDRFAILRPMAGLIRSGSISDWSSYSSHDDLTGRDYGLSNATVETGLRRDGVSPGDWFLTDLGSRHSIVAVQNTSGLFWNVVVVTPQLPDGVASYHIYRPSLFAIGDDLFNITSDGTVASLPATLQALADIGDLLQLQQADQLTTVLIDPKNGVLAPPLVAGSYQVTLLKKGRSSTPIPLDPAPVYIQDPALLTVIEGADGEDASISSKVISWSSFNPATAGFHPGDLFNVLTDGSNKTQDVGYGPGVYPIAEVSGSSLLLTVALASGSTQWSITRRL